MPARWQTCLLVFSRPEPRFSTDRPSDTLPCPAGSRILMVLQVLSVQLNRAVSGGARLLGNGACAAGVFLFKWVSIFSMTTGSWMQAITLTAPPHLLQVSMSILNTRLLRKQTLERLYLEGAE